MLMKRKKFTEAAQDFTALIDGSEPDCQETAIRESAKGFRSYALGARADCYHQLHLSDKALADINQALAITPKSPQLLKTRADIYSEAGKYGEAINDLSKALEIADRNGLRLDRARLYAKQNDWPSAIKDYSSIIESDRGFLKEALNGRAAAYNATKQSQAAQADLARAQKLD